MGKVLKPVVLLAVAVAASAVTLSLSRAWSTAEPVVVAVTDSGSGGTPHDVDVEMERRVERFCGDCHALPEPANFPAELWRDEVQQGYEFYARSGRQDLHPPPPDAVFQYYLSRAPRVPSFPPPAEAVTPLKTSFRVERRYVPPGIPLPEISALHWVQLGAGQNHSLLACDIQYGQVVALSPNDAEAAPQILTRLQHPAHLHPCSLSNDGSTELLVADLGSYKPADHERGSVVLLKRSGDAGVFEKIVLASGFGRIADVRTADFDRDRREDFVVAEFGWQKTGGIWLFRNVSTDDEPLQFDRQRIDIRPGTIHVPVHDFDQDGFPDFAALTSQEFESVELFLNATERQPSHGFRPQTAFDRYTVWSGPDLTFGSSGLQLSDLNNDGRTDLLITSGDAWDNNHGTPSHGVHWLENLGQLRFQYHRLAWMPGAYSATPCDVDNDGDLDVIAVSLLPLDVRPESVQANGPVASIICLEQTETGKFVRHTLETGSPFYSSVAVGDFDRDGDFDFAVGSGPMVAEDRQDRCYLAIWWNASVERQR